MTIKSPMSPKLIPRVWRPYLKVVTPKTESKAIDIKSVNLSAKTIGAERLMGVPFISLRRYDFNTSPILPGVIAMVRPEIKIARLSF